ncbi:mitochondrial 37S ribosomal protein mS35 NDAI_0A01180 [Naumovozyma dairenensis CBS 421]|uniref:Small ribosomal subunit protein mS35 n=1 Tax=Naumovozyma dairenensis (strain ATCC 10597 / BCRC 20456 / CBS 421 / NBRC 0211 / NRRL Y-12639) TaxID=1071378 RepID=G0W388_NAUDC|nr:hypothetical protein NDAI_0A01180 [Naumovozyma dairenensis CBS 421]CCD22276.1 hypothetical protein NDAI_0A01180 [Naumovozyma dairenensis CBS 421]
MFQQYPQRQLFIRGIRPIYSHYSSQLTTSRNNHIILSRSLTTSTDDSTLYLNPAKWINLPPKRILQLYKERVGRLAHNYKPCKEELNALLTTSEFTETPKREIERIYHETNLPESKKDTTASSLTKSDWKYAFRPYAFDELPSASLDLVEQYREQRFYNRLTAFELPLLVKYRQPYKRPDLTKNPIIYKYTSYIGEENHPHSRKVVLSCKCKELPLNEKQLHKFKLLAKTRYDHITDIFKMSTDRFSEATQNSRYLHDIFQRLLNESKDLSKDDFSDVPLDTRHTIAKNLRKKRRHAYKFPKEWERPQDAPPKMIPLMKELQKELNGQQSERND